MRAGVLSAPPPGSRKLWGARESVNVKCKMGAQPLVNSTRSLLRSRWLLSQVCCTCVHLEPRCICNRNITFYDL